MNYFFRQRRDRLLTYQAMREGKIPSARKVPCPQCGEDSSALDWSRNRQVCPRCGFHKPIGAYYRLSIILDPGTFQELEEKLEPADPLNFPGYPAKLAVREEETGPVSYTHLKQTATAPWPISTPSSGSSPTASPMAFSSCVRTASPGTTSRR